MTYFIPVFFVCLTSGFCDFVYTDPLPTEAACQQELTDKMDYLEANPGVEAYRPVCLEIDIKAIST